MALRIRRFEDSAELTLKVSQEVGTMEYNQALSADEVNSIIGSMTLPEERDSWKLEENEDSAKSIKYPRPPNHYSQRNETWVWTSSSGWKFYFDVHDYEIELKVQDAEDGKLISLTYKKTISSTHP